MMGIACIFEGIWMWSLLDFINVCDYTDEDWMVKSINFFTYGFKVYENQVTWEDR